MKHFPSVSLSALIISYFALFLISLFSIVTDFSSYTFKTPTNRDLHISALRVKES